MVGDDWVAFCATLFAVWVYFHVVHLIRTTNAPVSICNIKLPTAFVRFTGTYPAALGSLIHLGACFALGVLFPATFALASYTYQATQYAVSVPFSPTFAIANLSCQYMYWVRPLLLGVAAGLAFPHTVHHSTLVDPPHCIRSPARGRFHRPSGGSGLAS